MPSNSRRSRRSRSRKPSKIPYCSRLEAQLQAFDRGGSDAARADQLRKFEEAAANQQTEIDRQEAAAQRAGCEKNSFFVLFSGQSGAMRPAQQQDPADAGQSRPHPGRHRAAARRCRRPSAKASAAPSWWRWRRTIAAQQYQQQVAATPPPRSGGCSTRCSARSRCSRRAAAATRPARRLPSGTFRTICVRTCDGFYYPISAATSPARFAEDEKACRAVLPGRRGAALFASQSGRGHQPGGVGRAPSSPTRRCRMRSAIAPRSTRPAVAGVPARAGRRR